MDSFSNYYDLKLKEARQEILNQFSNHRLLRGRVEDKGLLMRLFDEEKPDIVLHFAAQAGVRFSIESPRSYLNSNIIGTFEILEAARAYPPKHMLLASTSSVYGANDITPYKETDQSDFQISFYAATKKSTENIAHSYSHLFNLPITMLRFFTVYGPWGRPDMALFKFTKAILENKPIDLYNNGKMSRDFTYIDDLINSIRLLIEILPENSETTALKGDSLSPIAPFRIINIGNSNPISLTDFIDAIEFSLGKVAIRNLNPMQKGDLRETWADTELLFKLTNFAPSTNLQEGVTAFVNWYREFYKV